MKNDYMEALPDKFPLAHYFDICTLMKRKGDFLQESHKKFRRPASGAGLLV